MKGIPSVSIYSMYYFRGGWHYCLLYSIIILLFWCGGRFLLSKYLVFSAEKRPLPP